MLKPETKNAARSALLAIGMLLISLSSQAQTNAEQKALNEGYSLLYGDVSALSHADLLLDVKLESDDTQQVVDDIADYLGYLAQGLQQLAQDYPAIRLDLEPLPAIERKTVTAATKARIKSFAPLVGRTGPDFERTLLLTLSGGLNSLRHLTQVIAEAEEPYSEQRAAFMNDAHAHLESLYEETFRVLNRRFFKVDAYADASQSDDRRQTSGEKETAQ